jgi:hypothetical protein
VTNESQLGLIQAYFEHLASVGWDGFSYESLSEQVGLKPEFLKMQYPWPIDFVKGALRYGRALVVEHAQLYQDSSTNNEQQSQKDKIFDSLMLLFDVFAPMRRGIEVAQKKILLSPCLLREIHEDLFDLLASILQQSNINTAALVGTLRVWGFGVGVLCMGHIWLDDSTEDLSKTMVAVDEKLSSLKTVANFVSFGYNQ